MSNQAINFNRLLQVGDQFDQFQIQAHIAQGGMSDIYRAYDLVRRRDVAIKIPNQSMLGDPAQYERFQRELEIMNTLKHPVILSGLGSGQYNRIPYLVMEYINGESLRKLLDSASPLTPDHALVLIRKIADGLAYCHQNNVVHRDLKPENILITSEGQPVIMDFGLALTKGAHRVTYSNLSETMGTPDYMAPEQIEGHRGDQRTDIYALGIIFFELLVGEPPFTGDSNLAVMAQHLHNTAARLDHINSAIPIELASTVAHCLARNPENRYPDINTLLYALDHPETVELTILDQIENVKTPAKTSILQSQTTKAIGISIVLMLAIILLALALQSLR